MGYRGLEYNVYELEWDGLNGPTVYFHTKGHLHGILLGDILLGKRPRPERYQQKESFRSIV